MTFFRSLPAFAALLVLVQSNAFGLAPGIVEQSKHATALVEIPLNANQKVFGSAFCIDATGLFVTNAHVADEAAGGKVTLIISPGETDQRIVTAKVLKSVKEADLALLQAEGTGTFAPVPLGQASTLFDTMEVTAFGYPFGGALSLNSKEYPSISVSTGHVTSLRKKAGSLELIQLDAALNPGNSGGPVLDSTGKVIGIVQAGVPGAGINFAIPVSRLQKLIAEPMIIVTSAAPFEYAERFAEHPLTVKVVSFAIPAPQYAVELSLHTEGGPSKSYAGQTAAGACSFSVIPVPRNVNAKTVAISATFSDGTITGRATDKTIKVGESPLTLSTIRTIAHPDATSATAVLISGKEEKGAVKGLEAVVVSFGEMSTTINLAKASSITFDDGDRAVGSLLYKVTIRLKGEPVGEASGEIAFSGAPEGVVAAVPDAAVGGGRSSKRSPAIVGSGRIPADRPAVDVTDPKPVATAGKPVETAFAGNMGDGGHYTSRMPDPPQNVVGFRVKFMKWGNRDALNQFDCLYDRQDAGQETVVMGKAGFVVGGLLIDSDEFVHAVKVIFVRERNGIVDPKDRYVTPWMGTPTSGSAPKQIAGHGEHVVGVCGQKGMNFAAIGLVIIPAE